MFFLISSFLLYAQDNNFQFKIEYNLANDWKKSDIKLDEPGFEEIILKNNIPFGDENYQASITIVHRIIPEPDITVRKFAVKDHEIMVNYLKNNNTSITYIGQWDPYKNIKSREYLSYMSIYFYLLNEGDKTFEKIIYIHVGNGEFFIITFNSVNEDYISDKSIKFFLDSLNFISIKNSAYEGNEKDYYDKAMKLADEKKYEEAVKAFETAIELKNDYPEVYYELAVICYYQFGLIDQAVSDLKTALIYKKDYSIARNELANLYWSLGRERESIKEFELAIKYSPDYFRPYYNLGVIYMLKNQKKRAEEYFIKSIELKEDFASSHYNLGNLYSDKKDYEKAIKEFQLTIEYDPEHGKAYYNLGLVYESLNQIDLAIEYFTKSLDFELYVTKDEVEAKIKSLKSRK